MKKNFDLSTEVKKLLINNKYYVRYNRKKTHSKYERNYHYKVVDPDGKTRILTNERKFKLRQLKYITSYLKKRITFFKVIFFLFFIKVS